MKMSRGMLGRLDADVVKKAKPKQEAVVPVAQVQPTPPPPAPVPVPPAPSSYRFQVTRGEDGKIKEIMAIALTEQTDV